MLPESAQRIVAMLPPDARVLDVGAGANPFPRADAVIDLMPYPQRGLYGAPVDPERERFDAARWVERDICAAEPWPFDDDEFDFAVCSHTLEDVRDPIRVCAELSRIAKAGYVELPAPVEELSLGVHGDWVGWSHHRWITEIVDGTLVFAHKPHLLPAPGRHLPSATVTGLRPDQRVLTLWWQATLPARERVFITAEEFDPWLDSLLAPWRPVADAAGSRGGRWGGLRPAARSLLRLRRRGAPT